MPILRARSADASARFLVRALKARLRDERTELAVIRRHLRPGDIACDIGANKGSFIYWLSRWVGDGRVVAFEPQPELARNLARLCDLFGLANVTVEAKAAYSHSGAQDLYVPEGHGPGASLCHKEAKANSFEVLSVPAIALDDYFTTTQRVALLKIDVEGAELAVLRELSGFCAGMVRCWFSNARTAIFCTAMLGTSSPFSRASATRDISYAGTGCCRSPHSMRRYTSGRTANGSGSARTIATISFSESSARSPHSRVSGRLAASAMPPATPTPST
ncbi:FkbM family methyltransferase [uncultured Bradyrhizobium sp.]|jgi:FkbM family methyltransferase|uniref:FkbM family methyltransferase n=1 Tax=uncultured Bradyrhizobium sp. TaxID=199684 RepID=UPI003417FF2C